MGREEQIIDERIRKLEELKKAGINPYPSKYKFDNYSIDIKEKYKKLKENHIKKDKVSVAGRVMLIRNLGKLIFVLIRDSKGDIQLILQKDKTNRQDFENFKKYIDSGDFIGVEGVIMKTKTGEISVLVKRIEILSKSLLPLPEKWHGIQDNEEKLRKRYLDILMNDEIKELFIKKSKFWNETRKFLLDKGFLEVETPSLETSAGGASATPFKTHHNTLNMDVYLRISMGELWQKKLMVAGYEKTFEIGRQFRNEGIDMEHLQDYTQMEFYMAYSDYKDGMKLVEELYKRLTKEILGKIKFKTHGYEVDLGKKWEIYDYEKTIKKYTKIDIYSSDEKEIKKVLDRLNVKYDKASNKWKLIDILWKYCRKKIAGPGFLVGQPVELAPLSKRDQKNPKKVEQFQVIIAGTELGNGYSELNDPIDQEERFKKQSELKEKGDIEAHVHDKEFLEALKYGMPPVCGFGFSERLFAYLIDKPVRDCVIFPLMKPTDKTKLLEKV